jgi:hypothetical protein
MASRRQTRMNRTSSVVRACEPSGDVRLVAGSISIWMRRWAARRGHGRLVLPCREPTLVGWLTATADSSAGHVVGSRPPASSLTLARLSARTVRNSCLRRASRAAHPWRQRAAGQPRARLRAVRAAHRRVDSRNAHRRRPKLRITPTGRRIRSRARRSAAAACRGRGRRLRLRLVAHSRPSAIIKAASSSASFAASRRPRRRVSTRRGSVNRLSQLAALSWWRPCCSPIETSAT